MPGELLLINPRKRKTKAKRAAPRRAKKRTTRRAAPVIVMANPKRRSRRGRIASLRTSVKRASRKYRRNPIGGKVRFSMNSIIAMTKGAAIGAAGALAVDLAFSYAKGYLPASMQSPTDATGAINPMYFAAKGAVAVGVGVLGGKVTKHATAMAAGSLTVSLYEVMRSMVPASVQLGYINPAMLANRRMAPKGVGRFVSGAPRMAGYNPPVGTPYMGQFVS